MLPQGIFAVAVTTVLFPTLARLAARADEPGLRRALDHGIRLIGFLLVPAGLVSIVLAEPIVRLVYERGEFTAANTVVVAQCLQAFSLGLVFNGWVLLLNRSFYAVQSNWVPTGVALGAVGLNAVFNTFFYRLGIECCCSSQPCFAIIRAVGSNDGDIVSVPPIRSPNPATRNRSSPTARPP